MLRIYQESTGAIVLTSIMLMSCGIPPQAETSNDLQSPQPVQVENMNLLSGDSRISVPECPHTIWSAEISDDLLIWEKDDVYLIGTGHRKALFAPSFERFHRNQSQRTKAIIRSNKSLVESEFLKNRSSLTFQTDAQIEIKSIVGRVATFEVAVMSILEGSPALQGSWWLALDLSKPGGAKPFSVDDDFEGSGNADLMAFYPESEIFGALMKNERVLQGLEKQERKRKPQTIADLLENEGKYIDNPRIEVGDKRFLTASAFEHFVFDRVEEGNAVVRLATVDFASAGEPVIRYIEISLPRPEKFASGLRTIYKNQVDKVAKGCHTALSAKSRINVK